MFGCVNRSIRHAANQEQSLFSAEKEMYRQRAQQRHMAMHVASECLGGDMGHAP